LATVDNLDINVYNLYAVRTKMVEEINQQLRLDQAASIPPQTQVINYFPSLSELDILLGTVPLATPWAYFLLPPKKFTESRRTPFSFARVAPTLGSLDDRERIMERVESVEVHSKEEKEEKEKILACLKEIDKVNSWLKYIVGRIGQFLQG
jgi:hypothetical protein